MRPVTLLFLTTDIQHRYERSAKALACAMNSGCHFDHVVVTVDVIEESNCWKDAQIEVRGMTELTVVQAPCTGYRAMVNNMSRGLEKVDPSSILVYCEDHIFVEHLPDKEDINQLFYTHPDAMRPSATGWVNLNTHVHQENLLNIPGFQELPCGPERLEYINDKANWNQRKHEQYMLKRESIADEYMLNFPVAMTTARIFRRLLDYGLKHYKDIGVEIGFTRAWYDTKLNRSYNVLIMTTPCEISFTSFKAMHNRACMRFRNNDPSMIHPSVVDHADLPKQQSNKRAFF